MIHEELADYVSWFKLLFIIPIALFISSIFVAFTQEAEVSPFLAMEGFIFLVIFHFIMPRRYQIYHDRLRIVLGSPLAINIPLSSIRNVSRIHGANKFVYSGVRFVTSTRYVIEIRRDKGLNYIFSPVNGEYFQEQLELAIKSQST